MTPSPRPPEVEMLAPLGFSELEASIYCFLLKESPATGYRVSHAIDKPTANTYKALTALERRGAVVLEDGENRMYGAVPPEELLGGMERRFREQSAQALGLLQNLHRKSTDDRVFSLSSPGQVYARAQAMLGRATRIALLDVFPAPLEALREALAMALERGVEVALQGYAPVDLPGALVLESEVDTDLLDHWPGQQLSLVTDAREHLLALFSRDGGEVHQAIWSQSTFLSCMQHNHLACELRLRALTDPDPARRLAAEGISILRAQPPGLHDLEERFGDPPLL